MRGEGGWGNIKTLEIPRFNRPARVGGFSGEKDRRQKGIGHKS